MKKIPGSVSSFIRICSDQCQRVNFGSKCLEAHTCRGIVLWLLTNLKEYYRSESFPRLFLVNYTQTPPPFLSKVAKLGFCSKKWRNVLTRMKIQFSDFSFWDMVDFFTLNSLNILSISTKNRKKSFVTIYAHCAMFWNECRKDFQIFEIF